MKRRKSFFRAAYAISIPLLILLAGILPFWVAGDGLQNLTGPKREAAKIVLDSYDNLDDGFANLPGISHLHVSNVTFTPKEPRCADPNEYYSYTVKYDTKWWFGITTDVKSRSICKLFGG